MSDGVLSMLPMDVSLDILSRLPLKTISQCRWVCKTWYGLVLHPRFAKIHYSRMMLQKSSPCVVFRDWIRRFHLIDHQVFDNFETSTNVHNLHLREFKQVFGDGDSICYDVMGSVNGLVCFSPESNHIMYSPSPFYIWNPITGDYTILPRSPKIDIQPLASGFGFDPINEEYKIVRILQNKSSSKAKAEVYTLGSGSWRVIENVPKMTITTPSNVFVNGNLHWVSRANESKVVSFNVRTEEFNVIHLPPFVKKSISEPVKGLGVLGEHLCLLAYDCEIWVMKDYGVHDSWEKKYFLNHIDELRYLGLEMIQLKNGQFVLIGRKNNVGYYDPENNIFRPIVINNLEKAALHLIWQPIVQVGSLFSPKNIGCH